MMIRTAIFVLVTVITKGIEGTKQTDRALGLQPAEVEKIDLTNPCDGTLCGVEGACRRDCESIGEKPIEGNCIDQCTCCSRNVVEPWLECEYNGRRYQEGEQVKGICVNLICQQGQWVSNGYIDECCKRCHVIDDPHFSTYDNLVFDFHGTCNYSITQEGVSTNPPFGVFGDFRPYGGWISCVDVTTFKDNEHTVITMTYAGKENVTVNAVDYTVTPVIASVLGHPVLAWRVGDCIRFLGSQRLMVEYCWSGSWRQLYLYAHPALADRLYGLCGHFNYYAPDDLTHRDYSVSAPTYVPYAFGDSWRTNIEADEICGPTMPMTASQVILRQDPCLETSYELCYKMLSTVQYEGHFPTEEQLHIHSTFCATDICAFQSNTDVVTDIDAYFKAIMDMLRITLMNDVMTTPGAIAPKEEFCRPCNGTCAKYANCRFQCDSTEEEIEGIPGRCTERTCKCCRKKPICEDSTCGAGGTCRSCSCLDGEELITGACPLKGCLCCRKIPVCNQKCGKGFRCKPTTSCLKKASGTCKTDGCTCCTKWK